MHTIRLKWIIKYSNKQDKIDSHVQYDYSETWLPNGVSSILNYWQSRKHKEEENPSSLHESVRKKKVFPLLLRTNLRSLQLNPLYALSDADVPVCHRAGINNIHDSHWWLKKHDETRWCQPSVPLVWRAKVKKCESDANQPSSPPRRLW